MSDDARPDDARADDAPADDAALVDQVLDGDPHAFGRLYDRWFDRVADFAYRALGDEQRAADVAHDTFLSAWRALDRLPDPSVFGPWVLQSARVGTLDRPRHPFGELAGQAGQAEDRLVEIDDPARLAADAACVALVWQAANALGDRDREVLDLQLRHELGADTIAAIVEMDDDAVEPLAHRARQRLATAVGAAVLWRSGQPACSALRVELAEADVDRFDAEAVRVAERHVGGCEACNQRRRLRLAPAAMFAALPFVTLSALRSRTAFALEAQGVPMYGSAALNAAVVSEADPPVPAGSRRRWWIAAGIAAAIVLLAGVVAAFASSGGHAPVAVAPPSSTTTSAATTSTSTSTSTSTTSTSTTTTTTVAASTTTVGAVVPPPPTTAPVTAPATTTTTVAPVQVVFSLTPATASTNYVMQAPVPTLLWSVKGLARVHVYDDQHHFDSTQTAGGSTVCPGPQTPNPPGPNTCAAPPGDYVYTLDAYDANNHLVLHRTLTLTIS